MILYTTMPQEQIFPTEGQDNGQAVMMNYKGIPVLAEQEDGMNYRVIRIMSTDPSHFLNAECTPGTKISFS